jgi:hypothetical protein
MKKVLFLFAVVIFISPFFGIKSFAQKAHPDTVRTGIYITSIHNIDYKQKEYAISFWLWFNYKNRDFDFQKYLELPQAKSIAITYSDLDTSDEKNINVLLKLNCVMKDSWKIDNFPFNHQTLRLSIENAQYDINDLVFAKDTRGENYDRHALSGFGNDSLKGWNIDPDSFKISIGKKAYETAFGDSSEAHTVYSNYKVKIGITRNAWGLFWKIFLGMYISFLIGYVSFYIHADSVDSRFGLSVGALFAVIGNKYIIESYLPESSSFTLVDILHGLTLLFIIAVIASSVYVLKLTKKGEMARANRFDKIMAQTSMAVYLILNFFFIYLAAKS